LAEHRAQICLLGLQEIRKYWEVNNLVLKLFFQYLDESTAKKLRTVEDEDPSHVTTRNPKPPTTRSDQASAVVNDVSSAWAKETSDGALETGGGQIPAQPLVSFLSEDTYSFNFPGNMLNSSEGFDPFLDMSISMNDGLNEEGLDFLQRCL
jgi:hypothetical protein